MSQATPLFVEDMTALKKAIRMSGASQQDTIGAIEQALAEVRVGFFERLGRSRVLELQQIAYDPNSLSDEGITRIRARNAEVVWVKLLLVRQLPMLFIDAQGAVDRAWNEEGLTRDAGSMYIKGLISQLESDLQNMLDDLDGEVTSGSVHVTVIEPVLPPPNPGDTIWRKF